MQKFRTLLRIELMDFFSKYRSGMGGSNQRRNRGFIVLTILLLVIPFLQMSVEAYLRFFALGRPELGVTFMTIMTFLLMLFTALPLLYSLFFYSSDLSFLAALPIPAAHLILAKVGVVWLYLAGINLVLLFPVTMLTGGNAGLGGWSWFVGLIIPFLTTLPPLFLATLLVRGLAAMLAKRHQTNVVTIIFGFILLVLVLGTQLLVMEKNGPRLVALADRLRLYYPPAGWLAQLVSGNFSFFLHILGLNAFCVLGFRLSGGRLYRTALAFLGTKPVNHQVIPNYHPRSKHWQLLKRNLLIIGKQPVFFLHTLLSLAVPWVVFGVGFLSGDFSPELFTNQAANNYLSLYWVGLASAPALFTNLSATAISREGKSFWETRVLPVEPWVNIRARLETTVLINLLFSFLLAVPAALYYRFPLTLVLSGLLFVTILTWFVAIVDLMINIYRPYLNWTNPASAIKNNLNVLLSYAYRPLIAVIPFCAAICLPKASSAGILLASALLLFILTLVARRYLQTVMVKKFIQIGG